MSEQMKKGGKLKDASSNYESGLTAQEHIVIPTAASADVTSAIMPEYRLHMRILAKLRKIFA